MKLYPPEQKAASSNLAGCISHKTGMVIGIGQNEKRQSSIGYFVHVTRNDLV
jgi:hypothetical protein